MQFQSFGFCLHEFTFTTFKFFFFFPIHSIVDESDSTKVLDPLINIAMARAIVGMVAPNLKIAKFADCKQKKALLKCFQLHLHSSNVSALITFTIFLPC